MVPLSAAPSAIQRQTPAALPTSLDRGAQLCPPSKLQQDEGHSVAEEQGHGHFCLFIIGHTTFVQLKQQVLKN